MFARLTIPHRGRLTSIWLLTSHSGVGVYIVLRVALKGYIIGASHVRIRRMKGYHW